MKEAMAAPPAIAVPTVGEAQEPEADRIRELIDTAVARQAPSSAGEAPRADHLAAAFEPAALPDRMILLSRTLAGLVDLLVSLVATSGFILAADYSAGIDIFDSRSAFHYALVALALHFLSSAYFLGTGGQTIGMMLTELQVTRRDGGRPSISSVLFRNAAYLVSLLAIGTGLLWAIFDSRAECLQDKLSRTRVTRLV
jgi:uncharacterized RDD family membrane protein YckC